MASPLFTLFLLTQMQVAAAEEAGSNLWSHHMARLTQISLMRISQFGSEHYPYIVWLVCNIDLYALLSGAGTGEFLKAMLDNNLVPSSVSQLYPVAPSGHSVIYPEEHDTLPSSTLGLSTSTLPLREHERATSAIP